VLAVMLYDRLKGLDYGLGGLLLDLVGSDAGVGLRRGQWRRF